MTQFSDGVRIGTAGTQQGSGTIRNVPKLATTSGGSSYLQQGIPVDVVPALAISPVTSYTNNLATAQTVTAGAFFTLTAGTGISSTTINGVPVLALDAARTLQFTGSSTATTSSIATVRGYDTYGQAMSQNVITPVATATTNTLKAFAYVSSIVSASTTTAGVAVGVGSAFGLPFAASDFGYVRPAWNQIFATANTGFVAADLTSPATVNTGDVRGTYTPQTTSPDGAKMLVIQQMVKSTSSVDLAYGVQQV